MPYPPEDVDKSVKEFVKQLVDEGLVTPSSKPAITNHTLESALRTLNAVMLLEDKTNR